MSDEKTGTGFGALENIRISILVLGDQDRQSEAKAMLESMEHRHDVVLFAPEKTGFFTKFSAAKAAAEVKPHLIHALGLGGAAESGFSIAQGSNTALAISLSSADIERASSKKLVRAARSAGAIIVESEADADKLREASIKSDIYVTASPQTGDTESHRFFLGAIEIVYGRIIDPEVLPQPNLDLDGSPLVSIGGCSQGSEP